MRAWVVGEPGPVDGGPLVRVEREIPVPGPGEVLVKVEACAVCRTDLHLAEGDLMPKFPYTSPGHQVVGRIIESPPPEPTKQPKQIERQGQTERTGRPKQAGQAEAAEQAGQAEGAGQKEGAWRPGQRVGVAWLRETCQACRFCVRGLENLCPHSTYTGWDAHGGFAEYLTAKAAYLYPLPDTGPPERLAPLLCAGIIGYRALLKADLPEGGRLGIYGFGASAHLTAQAAVAAGARVHVVTRSSSARQLAIELGAASAGDTPPEPLDAAILFAPAGDLVPVALRALDRGGTLAIAGIHLSDIPSMVYQRHLFQERTLRSVTANTRQDGRAYLAQAAARPPEVTVTPYPFDAADRALADLAHGRVNGAAVLIVA